MPRCTCCRKKTVMEFECLCKGTFCVTCRLPEVHTCTADKGAQEKKELESKLVKVVGTKLHDKL